MSYGKTLKSVLAAGTIAGAAMAFTAAGASAATVTFSDWKSTNDEQLHPVLTITEILGGFEISSELLSPDLGTLVTLFFDFGTGLTNDALSSLSMVSIAPNTPVGNLFSFVFTNGIGSTPQGAACGNDGAINGEGLGNLPTFEGVACYKSTGPNWPSREVNPVTLQIKDPDSILTLASFEGIGLRYKESNNGGPGNSDKLFSATPDVPAPIPLPAAGLLLVGALGGLGIAARRRKDA